jgi:hypothetical protein
MNIGKTTRITRERYEQLDDYRAQVQLPEKLVWAICYGAMYNYNQKEAGKLRDALAEAIEHLGIENFRVLLRDESFRWYFSKWKQDNVAKDMLQTVDAFLQKHGLE